MQTSPATVLFLVTLAASAVAQSQPQFTSTFVADSPIRQSGRQASVLANKGADLKKGLPTTANQQVWVAFQRNPLQGWSTSIRETSSSSSFYQASSSGPNATLLTLKSTRRVPVEVKITIHQNTSAGAASYYACVDVGNDGSNELRARSGTSTVTVRTSIDSQGLAIRSLSGSYAWASNNKLTQADGSITITVRPLPSHTVQSIAKGCSVGPALAGNLDMHNNLRLQTKGAANATVLMAFAIQRANGVLPGTGCPVHLAPILVWSQRSNTAGATSWVQPIPVGLKASGYLQVAEFVMTRDGLQGRTSNLLRIATR